MTKPAANHPWRRSAIAGAQKRLQRRPKHKKPATCEVCGHLPGVNEAPLVFEHNHGTGEHRGWVCNGCNSAMGFAGDNPEILEALAGYLRQRGYTPSRSLPVPPVPSTSTSPLPGGGEVSDYNAPQRACQEGTK